MRASKLATILPVLLMYAIPAFVCGCGRSRATHQQQFGHVGYDQGQRVCFDNNNHSYSVGAVIEAEGPMKCTSDGWRPYKPSSGQ